MKRIIILSYDFPPNNGGVSRLCGEIHKLCIERGVPVLTITSSEGPNTENILRIKGRRGIIDLRMYRTLKSHLHKGDVILTETFHPAGIIASLTGYPTYMLAHGAELLYGASFFRKKIWPLYRRWVLERATKVIANSEYTRKNVIRCCPRANVIALPLAVDDRFFAPTCRKPNDGLLYLCSISRLEKFKAHDHVIKTIASLPESYRLKIRLNIGGKGPYKSALEQMVKALNLERIISFQGFIPDNKLSDFYSSHHLFFLCTREETEKRHVEGFGLVFLEAQACGTAVIGSLTGGIPDAIEHGNGGWLVKQDDEQELRNLLMHLIDHPNLLLFEGEKARKRICSKCTWNIYFDKLLKVLD